MRVSTRNITGKNLTLIPQPCRACLYWEDPAITHSEAKSAGAAAAKREARKAAWFLSTLQGFGNCGRVLCVYNQPVGYAQYSSAERMPNTREYGAQSLGTESEGVAFISCLYITHPMFRRKGLGNRLLKEVVADLRSRGFRAVETFARKDSANNPSGPIELYLGKGFHVVEDLDSEFALVRLDF